MPDLFGHVPPRPVLDDAMKLAAASAIAARLVKCGVMKPHEAEEVARLLAASANEHMDGYKIMRVLERDALWDGNLSTAEELDAFGHLCREEMAKAERAWAAEHQPMPPYPPGTRGRIKRRADLGPGELVGVYPHGAAQYLLRLDRKASVEGYSGNVVNFEDFEPEVAS